jgi:hypothetical protein
LFKVEFQSPGFFHFRVQGDVSVLQMEIPMGILGARFGEPHGKMSPIWLVYFPKLGDMFFWNLLCFFGNKPTKNS